MGFGSFISSALSVAAPVAGALGGFLVGGGPAGAATGLTLGQAVGGAIISSEAQKFAAGQTQEYQRAAQLQVQSEAFRQGAADLQAQREKINQVRQARILISRAKAFAAASGEGVSSQAQGIESSTTAKAAGNIATLQARQDFLEQASNLATSAGVITGDLRRGAAEFQTRQEGTSAVIQNIGTIGGSLYELLTKSRDPSSPGFVSSVFESDSDNTTSEIF